MAHFVDKVVLHATAGSGGHGCASVHREKFKPLGGPDGGNGGQGGDVVLVVDPSTTTLLELHHSPHQKAPNGAPGQGALRHGAAGADIEISVPLGTIVRSYDSGGFGEELADLSAYGMRYVIAEGGQGGLGNAALSSKRRKAPGFALKGVPGTSRDVILELKSVADVALVGFPSAGKSSLISVMSAAKPKIADYPFTTLVPNLGVVEAGDVRFTVADVPGLIPGASAGKGLGHEFLRHIERCAAIVHVIDTATLESDRDPISDLDALLEELDAYPVTTYDGDEATPLTKRPALVVLNKVDDPDGAEMAKMVKDQLHERGLRTLEVSAITRSGLKELKFAMAQLVDEHRRNKPPVVEERIVLRPAAVDAESFTLQVDSSGDEVVYRVLGAKPWRWVQQTDFANDEAVGYLADRLARLGVEDALHKHGAVAGASVAIGPGDQAVMFEWEPTMTSGAEVLSGPRGTDVRFDESARPTRADKRQEFKERMDAKTAARKELASDRDQGVWTDPTDT